MTAETILIGCAVVAALCLCAIVGVARREATYWRDQAMPHPEIERLRRQLDDSRAAHSQILLYMSETREILGDQFAVSINDSVRALVAEKTKKETAA